MPVLLRLQGLSNLFAYAPNISEIEIAVLLARRSNTYDGKIRFLNRRRWILGGAEAAVSDRFLDNLSDFGFHNG